MSGDTKYSGGGFRSVSFYGSGGSRRGGRSVHTGHTCNGHMFIFNP